MTIKVVPTLGPALDEEAWNLYHASFVHLDEQAIQRHLMYRNEFTDVMNDPRIDKYLAYSVIDEDDILCGLATYTNQLDAVPLISLAYFARHWPDHYAQQRIWYIGFVAVHPDHHGTGAFTELVEAFRQVAASAAGLVGYDVCAANLARHLPQAVHRMVAAHSPDVVMTQADSQSYWLYEFPEQP